ncbi:MAG TPA: putative toxin-antitoxin system toxin component, PIN family [Gemmataceae bacterium]|nr:putative toxin-antitoxin system toxin component, PIN family [Gemmataceae bacterium]
MTPAAVFDTVILLQAGGKPQGPAGGCLRLVMEDKVLLYMSAAGLAELEDVLSRERVRKRFPLLTDEHVATFLRGLRSKVRIVADVPVSFPYPRDPDDEHILNLTLAVQAGYLVTRDKDLLDLMQEGNPAGVSFRQHCPELQILDPIAFLAAMTPSPPTEASP